MPNGQPRGDMAEQAEQQKNNTGEKNKTEMTFLEHLEELRWRLIKSILAVAIGMFVAFPFSAKLIEILTWPNNHLATPRPQIIKNIFLAQVNDFEQSQNARRSQFPICLGPLRLSNPFFVRTRNHITIDTTIQQTKMSTRIDKRDRQTAAAYNRSRR